jgi:hypothetical protein
MRNEIQKYVRARQEMSKFYPARHGSDEWRGKRFGIPTASQMGRIITPAGKPSSQAPLYEAELIGERIFKRPMGRDISNIPAVRHGIETEAEAADTLQGILGVELEPGGFFTDDAGRYGCSPDRIIRHGNQQELVEIKCPTIPYHIRNLLFGPGDDYKAQVQCQLLVTGYDAVHFFSYEAACPPMHLRVERDEAFIRALWKILEDFCERLEVDHKRVLAMGAWGT